MKLFLLKLQKFDYSCPIGICDSLEKAEQEKINYLIKVNKIKKECPVFPSEELFEENEELYLELENKYYEFQFLNNDISYIYDIYIEEFELNQIKQL